MKQHVGAPGGKRVLLRERDRNQKREAVQTPIAGKPGATVDARHIREDAGRRLCQMLGKNRIVERLADDLLAEGTPYREGRLAEKIVEKEDDRVMLADIEGLVEPLIELRFDGGHHDAREATVAILH